VKKICFIIFILFNLSCLKANALNQSDIIFDANLEQTLIEVLTNTKETFTDVKIAQANTDEFGGMLIQAPNNQIQQEINNNDNKKNKFYLFDSVSNVANQVYKIQVEHSL